MSLASDLRAQGFDALLAEAGENLAFRGKALVGLIDYGAKPARDVAEIGLSLLNSSEIEFRKDSVAGIPKIGEVITDEEGQTHRISLVRQTRFTWRVLCEIG